MKFDSPGEIPTMTSIRFEESYVEMHKAICADDLAAFRNLLAHCNNLSDITLSPRSRIERRRLEIAGRIVRLIVKAHSVGALMLLSAKGLNISILTEKDLASIAIAVPGNIMRCEMMLAALHYLGPYVKNGLRRTPEKQHLREFVIDLSGPCSTHLVRMHLNTAATLRFWAETHLGIM